MPGGMVTRSVRLRSVRPSPRHTGQGFSTIRPAPRQRPQVVTLTIWPSIVERTWRTSPVPLHWGQVMGCEPGSAPLPAQVSQVPSAVKVMSFSAPWIASSKVSRRS